MSEHNPVKNDRRNGRRNKRLGENAECILCPERNNAALTIIELHHVDGRGNDVTFTVPACLNCHRRVTEAMARNGTPLSAPRSFFDALDAKFGAREAFFSELAKRLGDDRSRLRVVMSILDRELPEWRTITEGV